VSERIPPSPDRWISQTDRTRIVVNACLAHVGDNNQVTPGGRCTLTFVRFREGWVVYRHGIAEDPVLIAAQDAERLGEGLRGEKS
jgi:hypothetical protein